MANFITLNQLKQAVQSLLIKINDRFDSIVIPSKTSDLDNDSGFITNSSIPTNVSDLTNDAGYLTSYTETDPTVPAWAKASSKPTYTANQVGAMSTSHAANAITAQDITNWNNKPSTDTNTTYTISMSSNRITLTPSSGTATYVDLPIYNGGVT